MPALDVNLIDWRPSGTRRSPTCEASPADKFGRYSCTTRDFSLRRSEFLRGAGSRLGSGSGYALC